MFAARSILSGSYSGKTIPFADAPLLTGKALDAYVGCYREDAYNANTERYNSDDLRAVCEPELPIYRPRYDIESLFWVIADVLIHSKSPGTKNDESTVDYVAFSNGGRARTIGVQDDWSFGVLNRGLARWKLLLHPALKLVAPLLSQMTRQIAPEYEYLKSAPSRTHLHEAFRRLLLQFLIDHKDLPPIEIVARVRPNGAPPQGSAHFFALAHSTSLGVSGSTSLSVSGSTCLDISRSRKRKDPPTDPRHTPSKRKHTQATVNYVQPLPRSTTTPSEGESSKG